MRHRETCRRGYYDAAGWHDGDAPPGIPQWHSATCEGPAANLFYAREQCIAAAPQGAEAFMLDTIASLDERAMRYGHAIAAWLVGEEPSSLGPTRELVDEIVTRRETMLRDLENA